MNRGNHHEDSDYHRKRDRRDDGYYNSHSRRRHTRSRSRSRDRSSKYYSDMNDEENSWSSSNRDKEKYYDRSDRGRHNRERNRDRRDYEKRDYHKSKHYDSEDSDGGGNMYRNEPNNKVIVRGLAQHITEADIQCDLIQCGLKPLSIRLIRKKNTGVSRGYAFVAFSTIDEARSWIEKKQGVLILQDQYRATIQYSFSKETDAQYDKVQTDWYCGRCGIFNFKRRDNCFKCSASREESGSEGFDEISNILTKKIMLRNLDALTTEEKVLIELQDKIPDLVAKISKILICRDPLTQLSRGICYLNFENLVDSMNTFQALEKLGTLEIDGREVAFSYCIDSENRIITKQSTSSNGNSRRDNPPNDTQSYQGYQYTLADVPKLAEQATDMYAQNASKRESYMKYYTEFYTKQISLNQMNAMPSYGASIAQSAIERKQKMKADTTYTSQVETPKGNDGKKYPIPDVSQYQYDDTSGYFFDYSTGLYYDPTSQYYYNSEIGQYLYYDMQTSTYLLASSESNNTVAKPAPPAQEPPPQVSAPLPPEDNSKEKESRKQKEPNQDKVKVAKKIVKDMEKWAKQLNQKKDYTPIVQARNENSLSPPSVSTKPEAIDIGFAMLEKKERPLIALSMASAPVASKLVAQYHSDSDEHEDQAANKSSAAASSFNENDLIDFEKLTCMLCKRAFPSADVLNKHVKMSNLHKENLQKYKLQNGILDIATSNSNSNLNYRDRAKERRLKYGEADPLPINKAKERFQREMEKKASLAQSYQSSTLASKPIDDTNIGSKMLKAMGWTGSGLGKDGRGRVEIIETEQRVGSAGLGSKSSSYGAGPGDDYKTYIKKMMKKRYEEVQ